MMKKLKKALSLSLAFVLSLSLILPALADDESPMPAEEGVAPISVDLGECGDVEQEFTLFEHYQLYERVIKNTYSEFGALKSGGKITVSHIGSDPATFIYVYLQKFTKATETNLVEYYDEAEDIMRTEDLKGQYVHSINGNEPYFYLCNSAGTGAPDPEYFDSIADGTGKYWNREALAAISAWQYDDVQGVVVDEAMDTTLLYPGQSVTFALPDDGTDSIYQLFAAVYYPQYQWTYWRRFELKIDDALAASAPAEPEQTTAPTEPEQPSASGDSSSISVTVDGTAVMWTDAVPFIDANSRTMVPLRAVADAMSLTVSWDGDARVASFTDGSKTISFPIDSNTASTSDGDTVEMDTAAVIANERTYAPIRYLAEYFGYTVGWDGATQTVSLTK